MNQSRIIPAVGLSREVRHPAFENLEYQSRIIPAVGLSREVRHPAFENLFKNTDQTDISIAGITNQHQTTPAPTPAPHQTFRIYKEGLPSSNAKYEELKTKVRRSF
jgi:hypothetical protein